MVILEITWIHNLELVINQETINNESTNKETVKLEPMNLKMTLLGINEL